MIGFLLFILAIAGSLCWLWAGGIDHMKKNHSEYSGEDFLNWKPSEINTESTEWDDNKVHTEDRFH